MPNHATCTWTGASGMKYVYLVYADPFSKPPEIALNEPGNFIFAKKDEQGQWAPVYVGDGDLT
jgi:hypothetical protein